MSAWVESQPLLAALMALLLLPSSAGEQWLTPGPANTGHEELACSECHREAPGTARQQIQANARFWLGHRSEPAAFGFVQVDNEACSSCHENPDDPHPVFRFLEPRFAELRAELGPDRCTSCHREHAGLRSQAPPDLCRHCHEELAFDGDPLDVSHEQLAGEGRWGSCLGCHDFHGNHDFDAPHRLSEALDSSTIDAYLRGAPSPYGERVHEATRGGEEQEEQP